MEPASDAMRAALAATAPGTALREGLDRILSSGMGALIVIGDGPQVLNICSGGFLLDGAFSPQRLSELAKMDGAIILSPDASRIARANVHLVPNPNTPTSETGTRHRTAERVARSIDVPVISVSERMAAIAVYVGEQKHRLDPMEIEDLVTVRDVVQVLQRTEMVRRIAGEVEGFVVELGVDGRLVRLHLDELYSGVEDDRRLVLQDYFHEDAGWHLEEAMAGLSSLDTDHLLDFKSVAAVLHLPLDADDLDAGVEPRGHRLLSKVPRLPESVVDGIVEHMGSLQKIMRATIADLVNVEGVGETRARAIKEGLNRLAETSILDRYG